MTNVQSTITGNGKATHELTMAIIDVPAKAKGKAKAKAMSSTAMTPAMTPAEAIEIAFQYGQTMAGADGTLTNAFKAFAKNEIVQDEMIEALNVGYFMRKMGYDKEEATRVVGLKKYSEKPELQDDEHRTFEQQRIMNTVRVLVHRARSLAGVIEKSNNQVSAEATRAAKEAEKAEHEARLVKADELVNPKADTDPFDALARLALTMKSLANKYGKQLTGDRGMAWRDWLAAAPK